MSFQNLSLPSKILYTLLVANVATKPALNLFANNRQRTQQVFKFLLDRKYIRGKSATMKEGGRTRQYPYYTILPAGIQYLKENASWEFPWLNDLPDVQSLDIRGGRNNAQLIRSLVVSNTIAMALASGIEIERGLIFPSNKSQPEIAMSTKDSQTWWDDECAEDGETASGTGNEQDQQGTWEPGEQSVDAQRLADLINLAVVTYANREPEQNQKRKQSSHEADMLTAREAFQYRMERSNELGIQFNHQSAAYNCTAYIKGFYHLFITYHARYSGCTWNRLTVQNEIKTAMALSPEWGGQICRMERIRGILFVANPQQFLSLYRDTKGRRKATREDPKILGAPYRAFHIIPVSREGQALLQKMIMARNDFEEECISEAAAQLGLNRNENGQMPMLFPLNDTEGGLYVVGQSMNIRNMQSLEIVLERQTEFRDRIAVICYEWQLPYYKSVFPNLSYITVKLE